MGGSNQVEVCDGRLLSYWAVVMWNVACIDVFIAGATDYLPLTGSGPDVGQLVVLMRQVERVWLVGGRTQTCPQVEGFSQFPECGSAP